MTGGSFSNISFQTFYASKEEINCPLIADIVKTGKRLKDSELLQGSSAVMSIGYGRRILITGNIKDYKNIKREEMLEVADYDPVKRNLLILGPTEPKLETPIHWMIHNARNEVNAIIQINSSSLEEKLRGKYPSTEKEYLPGTFELIMEILKKLRDGKIVVIKGQGALFVGRNINDVEKLVVDTCEGLK